MFTIADLDDDPHGVGKAAEYVDEAARNRHDNDCDQAEHPDVGVSGTWRAASTGRVEYGDDCPCKVCDCRVSYMQSVFPSPSPPPPPPSSL